MKLDSQFCQLPLCFDARRLGEEVEQFGERDWRPHPQGHRGNSAISFVALDGDPNNDDVRGAMGATPHLARCPYVMQLLATLETVLGRTRLMRIDGGAEATEHVDTNYYWLQRMRVHVPIVTAKEVEFVCDEKSIHMAAGEAWIFDTFRRHNVLNPSSAARIHLVVDTVGSPKFWDLIGQGHRPFATDRQDVMTPRTLNYVEGRTPKLEFETVNFPIVMSPWEQDQLADDVFRDLSDSTEAPSEIVDKLTAAVARFRREWRAIWSRHGVERDGWPEYEQALERLRKRLSPFEQRARLNNGVDAVEMLYQAVVRPAMNPQVAERGLSSPESKRARNAAPRKDPSAAPIAQPPLQTSRQQTPPRAPAQRDTHHDDRAGVSVQLERPVFIVSAPRAGSTLLFETLARSPQFYTIGGEGHAIFEGIAKLHPAQRGFESNRLSPEDADPATVAQLRERFVEALRDRDGGHSAPGGGPVRMLEKTPKNALRVPFLNAAFPDAMFIYLYRDPRESISSMLDAWRSGRFVTYPQLPDWEGSPWSLLLIPEWRKLAGRPLAEVAAKQWAVANATLLDDLTELPTDRSCALNFAEFMSNPQSSAERLCGFAGVHWDQQLALPLPHSRHTLTPPEENKWRKNAAELEGVLSQVAHVVQRADELFSRDITSRIPVHDSAHSSKANAPTRTENRAMPPSSPRPQRAEGDAQSAGGNSKSAAPQREGDGRTAREAPDASKPPEGGSPLRSVHTTSFPQLLKQLGVSLLVSTYQAGKLIVVREDNGTLNTHFRNFASPMGLAADRHRLAIGAQNVVWEFRNQPDVAPKLEPAGRHDASYLPRSCHFTGDIRIHEIAWGTDGLWIVNTQFSCLCTIENDYSFVPRWRPPFISGLSPDDRCHLNGLALVDGRPKLASALGQTDDSNGWREDKAYGGCLIDIDSGETVAAGLSMPHSPRRYNDRLWILESGAGTIALVDDQNCSTQTVAQLPGFTRGLSFFGRYAFIGLSQVRESAVFSGIPITERVEERTCGVWVVDLETGQTVAFLRFEEGVQEIFAVEVLPGIRYPDIVVDDAKIIGNSFVLPDEALADVQQR